MITRSTCRDLCRRDYRRRSILSKVFNCRVCGDELTDANWYPSFKSSHNAICNKCNLAQRAAHRLKWRQEFMSPLANKYPFQCRVCEVELTDDNWRTCDNKTNNRICIECAHRHERYLRAMHPIVRTKRKRAPKPMSENRQCTLFLGVHVAEQLLAKVFKNVERMPINNPGYDFICNMGKKIDVKASCLNKDKRWKFKIRCNQVADFFLMIAFSDRYRLTPKHVWLIPREDVGQVQSISTARSTVHKWDKYELNIDRVAACCTELRS